MAAALVGLDVTEGDPAQALERHDPLNRVADAAGTSQRCPVWNSRGSSSSSRNLVEGESARPDLRERRWRGGKMPGAISSSWSSFRAPLRAGVSASVRAGGASSNGRRTWPRLRRSAVSIAARRVIGDLLVDQAADQRGEQVEVGRVGDADFEQPLTSGLEARTAGRTIPARVRTRGSPAGTAAGSGPRPRCRTPRITAPRTPGIGLRIIGLEGVGHPSGELLGSLSRTWRRRWRSSSRSRSTPSAW